MFEKIGEENIYLVKITCWELLNWFMIFFDDSVIRVKIKIVCAKDNRSAIRTFPSPTEDMYLLLSESVLVEEIHGIIHSHQVDLWPRITSDLKTHTLPWGQSSGCAVPWAHCELQKRLIRNISGIEPFRSYWALTPPMQESTTSIQTESDTTSSLPTQGRLKNATTRNEGIISDVTTNPTLVTDRSVTSARSAFRILPLLRTCRVESNLSALILIHFYSRCNGTWSEKVLPGRWCVWPIFCSPVLTSWQRCQGTPGLLQTQIWILWRCTGNFAGAG